MLRPSNTAGGAPPATPLKTLFAANTPAAFWRLLSERQPPAAVWDRAIRTAAEELPEAARGAAGDIDTLLSLTLGEGQFGRRHWQIGPAQRLYYAVKPILPRWSTRLLRRAHARSTETAFPLGWPIEARYARFQWAVARQVMRLTGETALPFVHFWPDGHRYAFVLTHDVETTQGLAQVSDVADLDASYGFRSSFNFVPERYAVDRGLLADLAARGFEVGVHGLKHDGKLFSSHARFLRRAQRINWYVQDFGAAGFRAPLTHRQPEWMQALEIDYDLSFFDTDPYEPIPGGTMSLWPFAMGRFIELPYTLAQDYTLTAVLGETTPQIWLGKVDFIREYCGLVLLNSHPDYLSNPVTRHVYEEFLQAMSGRGDYWHVLPREVARWWRARSGAPSMEDLPGAVRGVFDETGVRHLSPSRGRGASVR
jgi:hypothetical protein